MVIPVLNLSLSTAIRSITSPSNVASLVLLNQKGSFNVQLRLAIRRAVSMVRYDNTSTSNRSRCCMKKNHLVERQRQLQSSVLYNHLYYYQQQHRRLALLQQQQQQQPRHQTQFRRGMARNRTQRRRPLVVLEDHELSPRYTPQLSGNDNNSELTAVTARRQEIEETEQILERINAILPDHMNQSHLHYCVRQHLWYRATPLGEEQNEEDDGNVETDDHHQPVPQQYKIDVGLTPKSIASIGDVLYITLFNNSQKEGGPKLPELNSKRDHIEPFKQNMKTTLPFEEGELLFAIVWEGIEEDKSDREFYLVTGRNIWRAPIRGIATLNMEYTGRNWTTDPPTTDTVLLSIVCSKDDYYYKISQMHDGPLIIPDVDNSTSGINRQKKRIDKSRTMTTDDPYEKHIHPWVSPMDYHVYMEANEPI